MTAAMPTPAQAVRRNEEKWTKPLMDAGWTAIPAIIFEKQAALGLDAIDMNILMHLTIYWWTADNVPHPSVKTIATAVGVSTRTVQKRISALQANGFLVRDERRTGPRGSDTNLYRFDGLIALVTPFALEKLADRAKRAKETEERLARKKPRLTVVKND